MKLHKTKRKLRSVTITILLLCSFSLVLDNILVADPDPKIVLDNILVEGATGDELSTFEGSIPNAPTHPYPPHGSNGVSTDTILSVYVTDPNENGMNVSFYDASGDRLIGTHSRVDSGKNAWMRYSGLSIGSTYSWYAIASNEMGQNRSEIWSFTVSSDSGITAEYHNETPPTLDGDLSDPYWSGDWDVFEVNSRLISIKVKHDGYNLYFAAQWVDEGSSSNLFLYFEDDGSYPQRNLDTDNEDCKYALASFGEAVNEEFYDAHFYDGSWPVSGSDGHDGRWGAHSDGNWWYAEASIPLSTGSVLDIDVTAPEILGFTFRSGSPTGIYPVGSSSYDASTWTYLHILPELGINPDEPINPTPYNPFAIPGYNLMWILGILVASVSIIGILIWKREVTKK